MLVEGNPAPYFTLPDVDDQPVALSDIVRRGQNVLLIFLRHLG
jgi:peroxiredoxin